MLRIDATNITATANATRHLYARDYPLTLIEAALPAVVLATLALKQAEHWRAIPVLAACFSILLLPSLRYDVPRDLVRYTVLNSDNQRKLPNPVGPERQLWLVRDNNTRPLSVQTAIMKGGDYGGSPLVRQIAPSLSFRFYHFVLTPIDLRDYDAIYFGFGASDSMEAEQRRVAEYYGIEADKLRCHVIEGLYVAACAPL